MSVKAGQAQFLASIDAWLHLTKALRAEGWGERLWNDARDGRGQFDIVGGVHVCFDELCGLLTELGYQVNDTATDAEQ